MLRVVLCCLPSSDVIIPSLNRLRSSLKHVHLRAYIPHSDSDVYIRSSTYLGVIAALLPKATQSEFEFHYLTISSTVFIFIPSSCVDDFASVSFGFGHKLSSIPRPVTIPPPLDRDHMCCNTAAPRIMQSWFSALLRPTCGAGNSFTPTCGAGNSSLPTCGAGQQHHGQWQQLSRFTGILLLQLNCNWSSGRGCVLVNL